MRKITTIDIEMTLDTQKLLKIPEITKVPQGSIVQWSIKNFEKCKHRLQRPFDSLNFKLYFSDKSPFNWERKGVPFYNLRRDINSSKIIIAKGVADKKGDYKYGISVFDTKRNEALYDEDPILIVF